MWTVRSSPRSMRMICGDSFGTCCGFRYRFAHGRRLLRYQPTSIGVLGSGSLIGTRTTFQKQWVSIHRTEVQEALIAITGKNFGFDADAWHRWRQQPPQP